MVKRSKRLEPVKDLVDKVERGQAERLALVQRRLAEAQTRQLELERYVQDYQQMFQSKATRGINVAGLRDYQVFIARLQEAVQQQSGAVQRLNEEMQRERSQWIEAAARKNAVGKVMAKAHAEDRHRDERRLQNEIDERAQRQRGARP
ncbi:MAG: flagellar export protein FliJ [Steroidobacteraceae bacterium]